MSKIAKPTARIAKAKSRGRAHFGYVKREKDTITEIFCKRCQTCIRKLVNERLKCLANYKEVTIMFDDGSAHVTCLCTKCAREVTAEELEDIYCADLEEMDMEEKKGRGEVPWQRFINRAPTKIMRG